MLSPNAIAKIRSLAYASPQQEICGYVLRNDVFEVQNISTDPANHFKFPQESLNHIHELIADKKRPVIFHSHIHNVEYANDFSAFDIMMLDEWGLPGFVVHTPTGHYEYYDPSYIPPYVGREFHYAWQNCYNLVQDWYQKELRLKLPKFYLEHPDAGQKADWNMFLENIEAAGFMQDHSKSIRKGSFILMTWGKTINPNHVGVIINAEKNQLLHQPGLGGIRSEIVNYDSRYRKLTYAVYNHQEVN